MGFPLIRNQEAVAQGKGAQLVNGLDHIFPGKGVDKIVPVFFINIIQRIPAAGGKEIVPPPFFIQKILPVFGIVFGKLLRIQVHIVQIDIVGGKSLGHMGVSDAPVRVVRDAQNYTDAGADPGDRVRGNVPGEGIGGQIFCDFLIKENAFSFFPALKHRVLVGGGVRQGSKRNFGPHRRGSVIAVDEIPERPVATDSPGILSVKFNNGHRQCIKIMADAVTACFPGDDRLVVQVDPADSCVVFIFIRVFKANLGTLFIAFQDLFRRNGPAVIEPLQLGTAHFFQKFSLLFGLYSFGNGIDAQSDRHSDQFGENDLACVAFVEILKEAHIQLDQIKTQAL